MNLKLLLFIALITISSFAQNKNKTIGFKENKGQIIDQKGKPNNAVKYLLNSGGLNVQLSKNGFSYDIYEAKKHPINHSHDEKKKPLPFPSKDNQNLPDYTIEYQYHRIDIDFLNSNPKVELITEEKSLDYDNYYNIPNKPEGVLMVHQYKQITYKNIYPNIDVVFFVPKDTLKTVEYNFVVHPKGKISDIQLKFSGAETELVDNKIRMTVRFGEMEETLPASWTKDGELKKEIAVGYTKIKKNVYGFETAENVSNKTVIIDPVPVRLWGTYYGGEKDEYTLSLENDILGNTYICGSTSSMNFIATNGAHQEVFGSSIYYNPHLYITDGFIAKFDENGNRLWSTFYGGDLDDEIKDIAISNDVKIGFCGDSWSNNNISTPGTFKDFKSGSYGEMFFGILNSNGIRLWASYFGDDSGRNFMNTIIFDSNNDLYVGGMTSSTNKIATIGTYKNTPPTSSYDFDGFISKFSIGGNQIWGTYFGGINEDSIEDLAFDSNNNIIAVGYTNSTTGISTQNSFQQYLNKNSSPNSSSNQNYDGFITSLTSSGIVNWGTYFGSTEMDKILRVKNFNNTIYVSGTTNSIDLATPNVFESTNQDSTTKSFISKFNIQNQQKTWLSYSENMITDFDINQNEEIYLVGNSSYSTNNLATPNAFNPINDGFVNFIRKINNNCQIIWGTYLGNFGFINNPYIKCTTNDIFYVSGTCWSTQNINYGLTTTNSFQEFSNGNHESYLNKFKDCNYTSTLASSNSPVCIGNTLNLTATDGTNYIWTGPNGFTTTEQNPTIPNATTINSGRYSCTITGTGACDGIFTVDVIVGDTIAPIPNLTTLPTITGDCHTQITTIPTATDACAGVIIANTASPLSYSLPGTYTIVWDYDDGNNNISHQDQIVIISNQPLPTATSPQPFCIQQNATLNDIAITTGQNVKWYDKLTAGTLLSNTSVLQNGLTYFASQTINRCESDRIPVVVNIQDTIAPTGDAAQSFCTSQNPTLNTIAITGTNLKWYDSSTLGNLLMDSTPLVDGKAYYATQTINNCESTNRLAVTASLINSLPANDYDFSICDDLNDGSEYVKLGDYNSYLTANTTNYTFAYYESLLDAENEVTSNKITTASKYKLALGENTIYVRINSNTPCYAIAVLKINLVAKPIIPIQDIVPICENKSILIDAGSGADSYLWSNGKTTQTITIDNPGDLSVIVAKNYNTISCFSDKKFTVKTSNIAKITSIETQDWTDNDNTITVFVTGSGDFEYSIDGTNYQNSNQFSGVNSGEYTVQVRDKNGCGIATEEVYLLMYPKFFTPNGDGFNDTWKIKSSDIDKDMTLKIFDRFGKLLKELDSSSNGWDGTYIGQTLPATDYWFVATLKNGKEYKGHFSLKR